MIDAETARGVPLVELRTVNKVSWWTDSNGLIAFNEPGLMDLEVFFSVNSPGYEYPKDIFNNRGLKLRPKAGGNAVIKIKRLNIAERLYRITGQGIYRDSVLLGRSVPLIHPVLDGQVVGQDTVIATPYRGIIYWFWGDTDRPAYPLGNFGASGATSEWPGKGGLDPALGVDLTYFVDESGFSKPMCPLPKGGMHWIESVFTLPDAHGRERLVARMANTAHLGSAADWHLLLFNDEKQVFESIQDWDLHSPHESAHPFRARVDGTDYLYLFNDFRVPADLKSLADLKNYEAFTCLAGDGKWQGSETRVARDSAGHIIYHWQPGADRVSNHFTDSLHKAGQLTQGEVGFPVLDFATGARLTHKIDTITWNEFRQRWIAFFADRPGGVCFAEADTPTGPWGYARSIAEHGDYNFYNLAHHSFFDQHGGRTVYFEGTYTSTFSRAGDRGAQTPRYDYNQIMYRVALDDSRLTLPVAVYRVRGTNGESRLCLRQEIDKTALWEQIQEVAFFALPAANASGDVVPVYTQAQSGTLLSLNPPAANGPPLFYGLPSAEKERPTGLEGSWNWQVRSDHSELKFTAQLSLRGESAKLEGLGEEVTATGDFHDGKLRLTFRDKTATYLVEGRLEGEQLAGFWKKEDGTDQGNWSASRVVELLPERRSPALAQLKEYRRRVDGSPYYSIQPEPPEGYEPEGRPLCRVWKVPSTVLALDWKARPRP